MNQSVENYLKGLFALSTGNSTGVTTNALAEKMETKPSSVTDMMKKLDDRGLVKHVKYYGTQLTVKGKKAALNVVRRHRLWEVFLVEKLGFKWDEVHDLAEQLEHVDSAELVNRLEKFLGYPNFDPHGDPIPDASGKIPSIPGSLLIENLDIGDWARIVGVEDSSSNFLKYLKENSLSLGTEFQLKKKVAFDNSVLIKLKTTLIALSAQVTPNLIVVKI